MASLFDGEGPVRLVTWNINSIGMRTERLVALLGRHAPDAVCLQELKCEDAKFPFAALDAAGYDALTFGQKTYNGVALLTRRASLDAAPSRIVRGFEDGVDDPAARFVGASVVGTFVYAAYVPNGQAVGSDRFFYKLNWLARLRRFLDRVHTPEERLVVAGDFNVAPDDRDVHDPAAWREHILCSAREREALAHVQAFGLVDAFREVSPRETQFTWWDYRMLAFPKNHGLRIDLMLVSRPVAARLTACRVDRDERKGEKPSDHAPVVLDIKD